MTITRRGVALGALAAGAAAAAPLSAPRAEAFNVRMTGQHRGFLRGAGFAIPTYHVNFITSQQATSVMSIGARARLAMVMVGPDQALMRRLTNEAYADLRSQMEAAGLSLMPIDETRAMTREAGLAELPGNMEIDGIGPGITVGSSLRSGWVTFGPDAAPALSAFKGLRTPGLGMIGAMQALGPLNRRPELADKVALVPQLVLDFARMQAARPGLFSGAASVGGNVAFGVLASSQVNGQKPAGRGIGTPGAFRPREDVFSPTPFAQVAQGGAAVRAGASFADTVDENYMAVQRARGDAVMVDVPVWEGLVRDACRSYNAAIVQAVVSQQG